MSQYAAIREYRPVEFLDRDGVPNRQPFNSHYARHLDTYPWTHFGTFTTKQALSQKATFRLASEIASQIHCLMIPSKLKMFWVAEAFNSRDGYHLHCLLYCPREQDIVHLKHWYKRYGLCKILPKRGGASSYVAKYLHRDNNEYDYI